MDRDPYPSDLNDKEWEILKAGLPAQNDPRGRPREQDLRELLNGIFYFLRTGCSWRMLPHDLPPRETVYSQFRAWKRQGAWEEVQRSLREFVRIGMGREPHPPALIIDSQSVKTTEKGASRLRCGQESQRQEKTHPHGHARPPHQSEGPSS